jgi:hypothetical protein
VAGVDGRQSPAEEHQRACLAVVVCQDHCVGAPFRRQRVDNLKGALIRIRPWTENRNRTVSVADA